MLLTIDISNSHITMGGFSETDHGFGETPNFIARLVTERRRTADQYACELMQILSLHGIDRKAIRHGILSSVVPELTACIADALDQLTGIRPMILGPGVKTGLHVLLDNPGQLGSDLVAEAVAASKRYPMPCVIFDLGTATTVSVLDSQGKFRGGAICAGIGITLESLASRTSLLPHVDLTCPKSVIGRNTIQSMQSGVLYGTAAMIDGMIDRIGEELGSSVTAVAAGELAELVAPICRRPVQAEPDLLLIGLRMIYEKNRV